MLKFLSDLGSNLRRGLRPSPGSVGRRDARRRGSQARAAVGAALLALCCGRTALSQAQSDSLAPIPFGRIFFYPAATVSHEQDDNVLRRNEDDPFTPDVSSAMLELRPMLRFEIPLQKSLTTLAYAAAMREYSAVELSDAGGTSHYLDFTEQWQATSSLQVYLQDSFLSGITEQLQPGNELRFGIQPFRTNTAGAVVSLQMGPNQGVELGGSLVTTRFESTSESDYALNSRVEGLAGRYLLSVGPEIRAYLALDWQNSSQDRTALNIQPTDFRTRSVGLGMRRALSADRVNELRVSYAVVDFPEDPGESFRGITLEGNLAYTVGTFSRVSLKLKRGPQTSFFNSSSFFLNEMMELGYNQPIGQRLSVQLTGTFQRNSYPDEVRVLASQEEIDAGYDLDADGYLDAYEWLIPSEGLLRKDRIQAGSLGLLCHLGRALDFQLTYEQGQSHSNIVAQYNATQYQIFNYDYRSLTASLTIGWQR